MQNRTRHKFNAKRTVTHEISFASKKEARYYQELLLRRRSGEVLFFLRQVPLHLPGNTKYVCDFLVFLANGECEFIDVKGKKTDMYILKKKLVEATYPITITEI